MTDRQLVAAAGVFAVFLTACDQLFHVRTGTLVYHWGPQVWDQTVIVPVTFFAAAVGMLGVSRHARPHELRRRQVTLSLGLATTAYLLSGVLDPDLAVPYALALLTLWGVRLALRHERGIAVAACLVIAVGGVVGESALSALGEFDYAAPDVIGVPWWLFPLYLHGALAAADVVALVRSRASAVPAARRT